MFSILHIFRKLFFWSYGRSTWQYDVLCALILAFIFLTPQRWFENGELNRLREHQNGSAGAVKLLIWSDNPSAKQDPEEIGWRARVATNRPDARVKAVREVRDKEGRMIAYEVDIE